jgi:hypothetical protein
MDTVTIDELLAMAEKCVQLAYAAMDTDYTADPASVAQAAAQTATAKIWNERGTLTIERLGEYAIATVGMAGKLEVQSDE